MVGYGGVDNLRWRCVSRVFTRKITPSFQSIAAGERLEMVVQYSGILNDKMNGFYRSTYRDVDGQEKVMACTQFEVSDARKALPWYVPLRYPPLLFLFHFSGTSKGCLIPTFADCRLTAGTSLKRRLFSV